MQTNSLIFLREWSCWSLIWRWDKSDPSSDRYEGLGEAVLQRLRLWVCSPFWNSISVGTLEVEAPPGCFEGSWFRRGAGHLDASTPPACESRSLNQAPLAPVRGRIELVALPSSPSCQQTFGRVGPRTLMVDGHLRLPPGRMRRHALPRQGWGWDCFGGWCSNYGNGFAFKGGPVAGDRRLCQGHSFLEDF